MAASKLGNAMQAMAAVAPEAGYGPNVNFGRLTTTPMVVKFKGKGETPDRFPLKDGYTLGEKEFLELKFEIDLQEFNPNLQFSYDRNVAVRKSSTTTKSDWSEIVEPSLIAVFGNNWGDKVLAFPYVEVEDVPNVMGTVAKSGRVLTVPKFIKTFKNKAEAAAAREVRFGKRDSDAVSDTSGDVIPVAVAKQVKGLIGSVGEGKARKMMEDEQPFGNYDTEALIAAAMELG